MNKKGFTLMELLVVIMIIGIVGVASTVSFTGIDDQTAKIERENIYKDIQRSASLYLDLHSDELKKFVTYRKANIKLYKLMEENYVSGNLEDPVTGDKIDHTYSILLYIKKEEDYVNNVTNEYVDSCIVTYDNKCVVGSDGKKESCSDDCK